MTDLARAKMALFLGSAIKAKGAKGTATPGVAPATIDFEEVKLKHPGDGLEKPSEAPQKLALDHPPGAAGGSLGAASLDGMEKPVG